MAGNSGGGGWPRRRDHPYAIGSIDALWIEAERPAVSALLLLAVALLAGWIPTSFMAPRANAFQLRFRFIVRDLYLKEETGQRTVTSREQCSEDSRHSRT